MKSTIRLFRAVPINSNGKKKANKDLLERTIKRGFVFSSEVIYNYSEGELLRLIKMIETEVGLTPEQMNSSFHKSWQKVRDASIEQLFLEQIIHYFTTYGFEAFGIYDKDSVYIPNEELDLPGVDIDEVKLVVIKGYTKEVLKEKLLRLLGTGVALKEDTMRDVIDVALSIRLNEKEIEDTRNKEVKAALYEYLDLFPENPAEFLRYLIYRSIGKTLLIKDMSTTEQIKDKDNLGVLNLLMKYESKYGLEALSEIFYRFKPIFLAFRVNSQLKQYINKIRRLARIHHKPMKGDYLNEVTARIKREKEINRGRLVEELDRVNIFRKIRLAYALKFRTKDVDSILYRIRNGAGYATDFHFDNKVTAGTVLDTVLSSIVEDVSKNVKGKRIFIPKYVRYALPATEKQFTGDLPSGTSILIPKDMVVGIHWENVKSHRIDLDLSMIDCLGDKIGWDGLYRTDDRSVLFSGDVTDAPKGASELFYVGRQAEYSLILYVNYFNYDEHVEVPFKILVAQDQITTFKRNHMVDPNKVMAIAKTKIDKMQKILGLLVITADSCQFYFTETYIGRSITSGSSPFAEHSRKYLLGFYKDTISLNDIFEKAGAIIVDDKKDCDIDLSLENLEKDKIIELIS